jgi:hypothetical protein
MPDNAIYYETAYVVAAVVYVLYGLSIVRRKRRLRAAQAASREHR